MNALEAYNLKKIFRKKNQIIEAVKEVSLTIPSGEVLAFLGPNGAGKTTSIKMMAGLIKPDYGFVRILGNDPHKNSQALKKLGAVLEGNRNIYWRLTPEENLEYFGVLKGLSQREAKKSSLELIERFGLQNKRRAVVQNLSRGMQQKLAIAVALINKPQLLLLDEPTLGLDVEATEDVKILIKEIAASGCAILLTTHQLNIAEELSDRVAIIQKGKIVTELHTQELIRQFSGASYKIEMENSLDREMILKLQTFGVDIQYGKTIYIDTQDVVYQVLEILNPLPFYKVDKDESDLTQIFLKLVRGDDNN